MIEKGALQSCDICGRKYFRPYAGKKELDGGYTTYSEYEPLPEGWKSHVETGMLCPDCNAEYEKTIKQFKERQRVRPEAGSRKMIPLDRLKSCADLCIEAGWNLEEFRKNMDEWEADDIDG